MANSYVEEINVKISEKYKPPCRIIMPISYSQRLSLNKQLQDSRPNYDFHLEKSVLEKMKEWKTIRKDLEEERKHRLDLARQEFDEKVAKEKAEKLEKEEVEAKRLEESNKTSPNTDLKPPNLYNANSTLKLNQQESANNSCYSSQFQGNYVIKNGILMPIPVTNYSSNTTNILKPVVFDPQQSTRQAFNLSDFESDTSSPFDNMELKSINDLEELAQVLKSDGSNFQPNVYPNNTTVYQGFAGYTSETKSYGNLPVTNSGFPQLSLAYSQNPKEYRTPQTSLAYNQTNNSYSQVNTSYNPISTSFSQYNNPYASTSNYNVPSGASNYSNHLNGYMYNIPPQVSNSYGPYMTSVSQPTMQKSNCKSVPDLVKSLEKELDVTRLNDTTENSRHSISSSFHTNRDVPIPTRPKSTDSVYPKAKIKDGNSNLLHTLSIEQKEICKNVSLMGFPLERVARVCEIIGSDQKKIVDHLLALSELLDLGFSEKDASDALMKNNNDRDKALDLLIS